MAKRKLDCTQNGPPTKKPAKPEPAKLFHSVVQNSKESKLTEYVKNSQKIMTKVIPLLNKEMVKKIEKSQENVVYSIKILYEGGLIGKRKYQMIRKSNISLAKSTSYAIPAILPYASLTKKISDLNFGYLTEIPSLFGCKRNLEQLLQLLAEMYLLLDDHFEGKVLTWFGRPKGSFVITLGADGAPFGKCSTATSLLIGLANSVHRLASRNHNFMAIGANCKEDCDSFVDQLRIICQEMEEIEGKVYQIRDLDVTFKLEFLPADQKWLALASGELPNSARYPSSFANVTQSNMSTINGSIGTSAQNTWQPWDYEKRLSDAHLVEEDKKKFANKKNARNLILNSIAARHSRQESVPPMGKYVQYCYPEPLHNKNNA